MELPTRLVLPRLPFGYSALEPCLSATTVETHYLGHHQNYVTKYNQAAESGSSDLDALTHNFYGYLLHNLYWESLSPVKQHPGIKTQELLSKSGFFTQEEVTAMFELALSMHRGSGWTLLLLENKSVKIENIPNHELERISTAIPLLAVDAFEHSYYLDYQFRKHEYFSCVTDLLNWKNVEQKLLQQSFNY